MPNLGRMNWEPELKNSNCLTDEKIPKLKINSFLLLQINLVKE